MNHERTLDALHGLRATRLEDALLFGRAYDRVAMFVDGDDPPLAIYAIRANGSGKLRWWGHPPSARQTEALIKVVRTLDRVARPVTTGSWLVAAGNWEPDYPGGAAYDMTIALWKDPHGDMPFVVDREEPPETVEAIAEAYARQCIQAWRVYAEILVEAGVKAQHMTNKVIEGTGYEMEPVAQLEDVVSLSRARH